MSLGFKENLSHQGVYSAKAVRTFLGQVGACIDFSDQEVLDMFDLVIFFVSSNSYLLKLIIKGFCSHLYSGYLSITDKYKLDDSRLFNQLDRFT